MNNRVFDRDVLLGGVADTAHWDVVIIGGGATGLGIAVDAASRGYKTLMLERHDFAKGTSSRSTKLVHGGVRYLAMGDIKLVYDALRERGLIFKNAPHVSHAQSFIIPCYSQFSKWKYLIGLKLYDWLAGRLRIGKSVFVSKKTVQTALPGVKPEKLVGGVRYFDGQFDDARLAVNLASTAVAQGATVLNYCDVSRLTKDEQGQVTGVGFVDVETGREHTVSAKVVVNATGVFVDDILAMDKGAHTPMVSPSQGAHVVVSKSFLGEQEALMIPKTSDGRVLFGVPWHDHLVLGTTDTPVKQRSVEPRPLDEEVAFILETAGQYLARPPKLTDVQSMFAGLRPLAAAKKDSGSTKEISRDHKLIIGDSGLITITGGKWTTYRKMAEATLDAAIEAGMLLKKECVTKTLPIHGATDTNLSGHWAVYGSDAKGMQGLAASDEGLREKIHPDFEHIAAEVVWFVRHEMARSVEDVLARRFRTLFLNATKSMEMAPKIARIMAKELGKGEDWVAAQLEAYRRVAQGYLPIGSLSALRQEGVSSQ